MTTEEKELLLKDLCARLPYGVKVLDNSHKDYGVSKLINIGVDGSILIDNEINDIQYYPIIDEVKPYLRTLESITEEEKNEIESLGWRVDELDNNHPWAHNGEIESVLAGIKWLIEHHFDFLGLIPLGLAIEVINENNPYKD